MVDALGESWRVLVPNGIIVDVRPITPLVIIEAESATSRRSKLTEVESYGAAEDDAAVDAAVQHALSHGWLTTEQTRYFDFQVYCDSVADLKAYAETGGRMREAKIPYQELEAQRKDLSAASRQAAQLRCHRPTMLKGYRRLGS
jgi:hypothetical protein